MIIFRPELAEKVMDGSKTVTRRMLSDNPRSPWFEGGCKIKIGSDHAVCPRRGVHAIGRIRILDVRRATLDVGLDEARREGFLDVAEFDAAFAAINTGGLAGDIEVWRVEFEAIS